MTIHDPRTRRLAAVFARSGVAVSAVAFAMSVVGAAASDVRPAAAAPVGGVAQVITPFVVGEPGTGQPLLTGNSTTAFSLNLPPGAACTGDSATSGYRVNSYMIPSTVDPGTLSFDNDGPVPFAFGEPQSSFRQPLYKTTSEAMVQGFTAAADTEGGPGSVVNVPAFDFKVFEPVDGEPTLPVGEYILGLACYGPGTSPAVDKFWSAKIEVETDSNDPGPADIKWTVIPSGAATTVTLAADPPDEAPVGEDVTLTATLSPSNATGTVIFKDGTTTLASAANVQGGKATLITSSLDEGEYTITAEYSPAQNANFAPSTSAPMSYEIVAAGATSTSSSTTSTTTGTSTSTTSTTAIVGVAGSGSSGGLGVSTGGGGVSSLARTGGSLSAVVWGVLLLVFGRMAILLGRPPRVVTVGVH